MDWHLKCLAFHTVARIGPIYHFLQQHVTGRYHLNVTDDLLAAHRFHLKNCRGGVAMEFGAGPNLLGALLLSSVANEVIAIDLNRQASVERVNGVIRQLRGRVPGNWPEVTDLEGSLLANYRIRYNAPADARATGLPDASVDFICSTSVLEHIPGPDIARILIECRRIARRGAQLSFLIDYHDHYGTADRSISLFNFYRYPDWMWALFNPGMHYQNRLRHSDYVRLFTGWRVEQHAVPTSEALPPLCKKFESYDRTELAARNGFFVLG